MYKLQITKIEPNPHYDAKYSSLRHRALFPSNLPTTNTILLDESRTCPTKETGSMQIEFTQEEYERFTQKILNLKDYGNSYKKILP